MNWIQSLYIKIYPEDWFSGDGILLCRILCPLRLWRCLGPLGQVFIYDMVYSYHCQTSWVFFFVWQLLPFRELRDFLNGLDNLHEYLKFSYPRCPKFASHEILLDFRRLRAPSYFVSSETEEVGGPFTLSIATFRLYCDIDVKLYTIEQCVTVPKMFNDTDTGTFFGTKFFRYRFRDCFWYQILPIPVPRLFSDTKFF